MMGLFGVGYSKFRLAQIDSTFAKLENVRRVKDMMSVKRVEFWLGFDIVMDLKNVIWAGK